MLQEERKSCSSGSRSPPTTQTWQVRESAEDKRQTPKLYVLWGYVQTQPDHLHEQKGKKLLST